MELSCVNERHVVGFLVGRLFVAARSIRLVIGRRLLRVCRSTTRVVWGCRRKKLGSATEVHAFRACVK